MPDPEADRLDVALVARGLARSRAHASEMIRGGRVLVDGRPASKPAMRIEDARVLDVAAAKGDGDVSRAGGKLRAALDELSVQPRGLRCIDVGASTGGFTQVLLERGAAHVVAIDVGTDQLAATLRNDPRVTSLERTHVGHLEEGQIAPAALVVADLSFISLRSVIGVLAGLTAPDGLLLPMVKPQFEVGRSGLDRHGVVTDPGRQRDAVLAVIDAAGEHGLAARAIRRSAVPGPAGNLEYFVAFTRGADASGEALWARDIEAEGGASEPAKRLED
ncbi:TlyA family rRNA (cytidine-2'-O)-methyltransferase [Epidermidibacterium keratini]|uniref:TlyA family rRNA (Cytidine-2'-O)-methyltransferase n=2 Tax=Epidermidibacterium keratini TaxID=1891644 RepID=A0A7L4YSG9_9ACTN|nr:TlyA family rRNA (cytidine-2'-O)-methyltransferase [Epidermidibacterium keratini]